MFFVVASLIFGAACSSNVPPPPPAPPPSASTAASEARFEECREKLKQAQKLDVLYNLDMQRGSPLVVVGPTFYNMPFDAKQNFADTINGFLMAGENKFINFDLLDYRTNKVVAKYRYGKLKME